MKPLLSIMTLYNYDNTIFDDMLLPTGLVKDDVISNLLLELAEMEVIYPNPSIMKMSIGYWSHKELSIWDKLYNTTKIEYDPISNLRRTETYTEKEVRDLGGTTTDSVSKNGSDNTTNASTNKDYIAAYNESDMAQKGQTENTSTSTDSSNENVNSKNNTSDTGTVDNTKTVNMQGSIGVVLTQQMIQAEREVNKFNITDYIVDSFKRRFCLQVY